MSIAWPASPALRGWQELRAGASWRAPGRAAPANQRGHTALDLHPDDENITTRARDIIADILHAIHTQDSGFDPEHVLALALQTYRGDFEDEPPESA